MYCIKLFNQPLMTLYEIIMRLGLHHHYLNHKSRCKPDSLLEYFSKVSFLNFWVHPLKAWVLRGLVRVSGRLWSCGGGNVGVVGGKGKGWGPTVHTINNNTSGTLSLSVCSDQFVVHLLHCWSQLQDVFLILKCRHTYIHYTVQTIVKAILNIICMLLPI